MNLPLGIADYRLPGGLFDGDVMASNAGKASEPVTGVELAGGEVMIQGLRDGGEGREGGGFLCTEVRKNDGRGGGLSMHARQPITEGLKGASGGGKPEVLTI